MKPNRFREVLAAGGVPVGHMIMEFATRGIAKIAEAADVDFVVYDMEHSGFDIETIFDLMAWSKASPFAPFVRVPYGEYHFLARVMDAGALGVMVGNVETPEQAKHIVSAVKYCPQGRRGVGLGTAHNDYVMPDPAAYCEEINKSAVVICQIESETGVRNAEAIAAVDGVDVLWVGHYDLTVSMGIAGQFQHERFLDALRKTVAGAKAHGRALGIQPGNWEQAQQWRSMGFNVISWGADIGVYRGALQSAIQRLRSEAAGQ